MSNVKFVTALACGALTAGCSTSEHPPQPETKEIVTNLKEAGFPAAEISVVDGVVYVGNDAEVSLAASREMLKSTGSTKEQYRTTNTVSALVAKICVDGTSFTGQFSAALDNAIRNYNALPLTFTMARTPSTGCNFTINGIIKPDIDGGVSGFPADGLPFGSITIGALTSRHGVDTLTHVITHELGHTLGFRHSDHFDRSISCGSGGSEGDPDHVGSIHIPGTPTGATVGDSIMNSCFRDRETGKFTSTDVVALRAMYTFGSDILWRCVPVAPNTSCGDAVAGRVALWANANPAATTFPGAVGFNFQIVGVGDFGGDGRSDILWRSTAGDNVIWPGAVAPGFSFTPVSTDFFVAGVGDFNANGKSDILWQNPSGPVVIWDDAIAPGHQIGLLDASWSVAGVGDFNGDHARDILWRNTSGPIVIWPSGVAPGHQISALDGNWRAAGIGDFDGNGTDDILWRNGSTNVIWPAGTPPGFQITSLDTGWQVAGIADFDRNGRSDILWRRANGENALWLDGQASATRFLAPLDVNWQAAGVGKFVP